MTTENPTGDNFVEVYDINTGYVSRVPSEWLTDPRLGRVIAKTNAQLAAEHALPAPPSDATKADLLDYAKSAGLETDGFRTKADVLDALEPFLATESDEDPDVDDSDDPANPPAAGDNPNPS